MHLHATLVPALALALLATSAAQHGESQPAAPTLGPTQAHGGQTASAGEFHFEIVSRRTGIQIYAYDAKETPIDLKGAKGTASEGGFRSPCVLRWPGKVAPNQVINGMISGMDWFPTFVTAAGNPKIKEELLEGTTLNGKEYKVHLDGYDQTDMLTKGGESARNELWYFTQTDLAAARVGNFKYTLLDQPDGWVGGTVDLGWPRIVNLRLDPFERLGIGPGESYFSFEDFYARNMWRFVLLQDEVAKLAKSGIDYPPMQEGASLNLDAVKKKVQEAKHSVAA